MIQKLLLFFAIVCSPTLFAQDIDRVKVQGKVHVPQDNDAEGISVYNVSSQKGVITDAEGNFEIEVAENDRLQVFAIQYQSFTAIVDKEILQKKHMNIYVNSAINQLSEVILRPSDLTGIVQVDVQTIPTYVIKDDWGMSFKDMEFGFGFTVDSQTSIAGHLARDILNPHLIQNGLNVGNVIGAIIEALIPKKEKKINVLEKFNSEGSISGALQQRFSREYISEFFKIPEENAVDFLYFAQEEGLESRLLREENEFQLIVFLQEKAVAYKKRME